ncbi:type II toxin-antitoxin system RelE/ParE family toxin [Nodularia chucula]|uniref:type II toxin-antitoxin system RelE/ParE family toxin n=1 Tax=Nodularia chucula TaxID=3093667 RepID=UPI0039C71010
MNWSWELYQDVNGEIPKDLLAFFIRMIPPEEQPENPPKPLLSASETKRLQVNLGYLCKKGLLSLTSGIFEKLEDDLYELRMTKSEHNPRFILTAATPQKFIVLHAFMKKYDGAIKDRDKEPARVRLRELQQREES